MPAADPQRLGECFLRGVPLAQVLVRAPEVVQRDCLFAIHVACALILQRDRVDVLGLLVVAHSVIERGDTVPRGERVQRHFFSFSKSVSAWRRSARPGGVLALQPEQPAALEQAEREHLLVVCVRRDGHRVLVGGASLGVAAGRLGHLSLAIEHPRAQVPGASLSAAAR